MLEYTPNGETVTPKLYDQGDLNGDEKVDILDLVRAKKALALVNGVEVKEFTLDMNSDGEEDTIDLELLKKHLLFKLGIVDSEVETGEILPTSEDTYKLNPMVGGADAESLTLRTSILNSGSS